MTDVTPATIQAAKTKPLVDHRMKLAEFARPEWCVSVEAGTTLEDVMQPDFWAHVAGRLQPDSKMYIYSEDRSFYAELIVLAVGRTDARMAMLHAIDLSNAQKIADATGAAKDYIVKWRSPSTKYAVIRLADNSMLKDGFGTSDAGWAWLHQEYLPQFRKAA